MAGTFKPYEVKPEIWNEKDFAKFVQRLLADLSLHRKEFADFFEKERQKNASWANSSRFGLGVLGALALLLTGVAAALRLAPELFGQNSWDKIALVLVLVIYAVMTAAGAYEKYTDKTTAYFRHLAIILAIRDLWTKLQFEFLKEKLAVDAAADPKAEAAARERIRVLADAFCADLNKTTRDELTEWKTEFLLSLSELNEAAKKGTEDVTKQVQEITKAAEKAATDAKTAAEKAAADAKASAKAAEDAARTGAINFTVSGDYDEDVVVSIDQVEVARTRSKNFGHDKVVTGNRTIGAKSKKAGKEVGMSRVIDIKPGIQDVSLALT
jgi:hypothetical protein